MKTGNYNIVKPYNSIIIGIFIVLIVQLIVTYGFTYTQIFSVRALIRNLSILIPILYGVQYIWIPILLEIIIESVKYKGYYLDKYIATTYLYNDNLRVLSKQYPLLSNYSEGIHDGLLGFDMTDLSQENLKRIRDWGQKTYYEALNNPSPYFTDNEGKKQDISIKYKAENQKFDYICKKCEIKPGMKILEIGFGDCDFLKYIRKTYGISPVGVNIASEQVKYAKELGFEAHCLDGWKITDEIGTFDLVLQCGNLEYFRLFGESGEKYKDYCNIIKKVLNPGGKFFITCCHQNEFFKFSLPERLKGYILWAGNDGGYPIGKNGFTKFAKKAGFKVMYQEDRTLDYYIAMLLHFSFLRCSSGKCHDVVDTPSFFKTLLQTIAGPYLMHSYGCYQPSKYLPMVPFAWEFEPQPQKDKLDFPVTLEYILLQI